VLRLAAVRKVVWPVTVSSPENGGHVEKETFDVEFEVLDQDAMDALVRGGEDLLERVVVGWPDSRGPTDQDGKRVTFSPLGKAQLINVTYARRALFDAYSEIQQGRAAARKN